MDTVSSEQAVDRVAAKLVVLIEGIADHKMSLYHQEALSKELAVDIVEMCASLWMPQ